MVICSLKHISRNIPSTAACASGSAISYTAYCRTASVKAFTGVHCVLLGSALLSYFHWTTFSVGCPAEHSSPSLGCVPVLSCFLRAQLRPASDAVPITAHFRKSLGTIQRIRNTRAMVERVGSESCGTVGAVRGNSAVPLKVTSQDKELCVLEYIQVSKIDPFG